MATVKVRSVTANLKDGKLKIPYWDVDTGRGGPCLLVTAALHGNEVQGAEVIRRFRDIAVRGLASGRVLLVPFANLSAVRKRRPHITSGPETLYGVRRGYNINGTWPGRKDGTDAARITYALHREVTEQATHNVDIHCWPRMRGTTVLLREGHPEATEMARLTAVRFAEPRRLDPKLRKLPKVPYTLTSWFLETGRGAVCIELSGQYMVVEREIQRGLRAVLNVSKHLGLLKGRPEGLREPMVWLDRAHKVEVKAPHSGLFGGTDLVTSEPVASGQSLGVLTSDRDLRTTDIKAPMDGFLWTYGAHRLHCDVALPSQHPYADRGDTLAVIVAPPQ